MARLTWQNVAAPDFSSSLQGLRLASGMFSEALQGIGSGIDNFRQQQQEQADASVLARALGYSDPESFNRDMASGAFFQGVSPGSVSRDTLAQLGNRAGELLINAGRQQALDQNRYTHDRTVSQNDALDAARGYIGEFLATGSGGGNISDFYRQNSDVLGALTPDQLSGLFTNASNLSSDNLNRSNTRQLMGHRAATHNATMNSVAEKRFVDSQIPAILANAQDPEAINAHIQSLDVPEHTKAAVYERAMGLFSGLVPGTDRAEMGEIARARQQLALEQARASGRGSGGGTGIGTNRPLTDSEIALGLVQTTASDVVSRANATSNINSAGVLNRYINNEELDTPFKAGNQVAQDTGLPVSDAVKQIQKLVDDRGISPQAAAGIVTNSVVSSAGNRFTVQGSRDPILGARPNVLGVELPSVNDALSAVGINALGDLIAGPGAIVDDRRLSDILNRFSGTEDTISSYLGDRTASAINASLPGLMRNAVQGDQRAKTALDQAYLRNVPEREKEQLWKEVERTGATVSELERRLNELAGRHAR